MKEIRPVILKRDCEILGCMENDARHLLNWIEQARRGCNYKTDFIKPLQSSLSDCIKADAQSILNHIRKCEKNNWIIP